MSTFSKVTGVVVGTVVFVGGMTLINKGCNMALRHACKKAEEKATELNSSPEEIQARGDAAANSFNMGSLTGMTAAVLSVGCGYAAGWIIGNALFGE